MSLSDGAALRRRRRVARNNFLCWNECYETRSDERKYEEQTRGEGENGKEDKKFLYHKITLSSSDVIFYVPIYASGRRGDAEDGGALSCRVSKRVRLLRYKMKEARVERGCFKAEIEAVSCPRHPLPMKFDYVFRTKRRSGSNFVALSLVLVSKHDLLPARV